MPIYHESAIKTSKKIIISQPYQKLIKQYISLKNNSNFKPNNKIIKKKQAKAIY